MPCRLLGWNISEAGNDPDDLSVVVMDAVEIELVELMSLEGKDAELSSVRFKGPTFAWKSGLGSVGLASPRSLKIIQAWYCVAAWLWWMLIHWNAFAEYP